MLKLIASLIICSAALLAADKPAVAKLEAAEIQQLNQAAQASQLAEVQKQLAEATGNVAKLSQQLVVMRACWHAGIKEADCSPQQDGSLTKPVEPAKK